MTHNNGWHLAALLLKHFLCECSGGMPVIPASGRWRLGEQKLKPSSPTGERKANTSLETDLRAEVEHSYTLPSMERET